MNTIEEKLAGAVMLGIAFFKFGSPRIDEIFESILRKEPLDPVYLDWLEACAREIKEQHIQDLMKEKANAQKIEPGQ